MPRTLGDSSLPAEEIGRIRRGGHPIIEYLPPSGQPGLRAGGAYIARIIPDGATLQVGLGRIPNEMPGTDQPGGPGDPLGRHTEP